MRSGRLVVSSILILAVALAACRKKRDGPAAEPLGDQAYTTDVARICDVMKLSGAADAPDGEQLFTVADWLGRNLETEAGHDFLVAFQRTPDPGKAALLNAESARLGLGACALASMWEPS